MIIPKEKQQEINKIRLEMFSLINTITSSISFGKDHLLEMNAQELLKKIKEYNESKSQIKN